MLSHNELDSIATAYQLLAALYDPYVLEEGVRVEFPPYELREEMKRFRTIQDDYFETNIKGVQEKFEQAIEELKMAAKELIKTLEVEVA